MMSSHAAATDAGPALEPRRSPVAVLRRVVRGDLVSVRVMIAIALIWVIFETQNSRFLSAVNLTNLVLQITATGLISVGVVSSSCSARSICQWGR
jgi:ABC-type xylose transport system permease subunit